MIKLVKVLIVDDEVPVRREMAAYPWESYWPGRSCSIDKKLIE